MMVKPAASGGAEPPAPADEILAPDADDDADAVDALTGVGHDLPSGGASPAAAPAELASAGAGGETRRADPAAGAPARPTGTPADDDESAKMLMLLGELGGADDSEEEEEEEEAEEEARANGGGASGFGSSGKPSLSARRGGGGKRNASGGRRVGDARGGSIARADDPPVGSTSHDDDLHAGLVGTGGQSGPVGEWLKAEGEARMKMADHRRLIYRWTNAVYRLLGMKIPRGMGSLFDKGEKNKREKFDRFLSYYYGTETFEPGTYWYNNADTIAFFVELIRVATCDRYAPPPAVVQRLFRKKDPTRQASTWIMVPEELEKTDVTADELRALFEGEPRTVRGFPRGRPLFVPIPKNPKGHHKYTTRGEGTPASPQPNRGGAGGRAGSSGARAGDKEKAGGGKRGAAHAGGGAAAPAAQAMAAFGAAGSAAQQKNLAALAQSHHAALLGSLGALGAQFGLTEAQMGQLGQFSASVGGLGGIPTPGPISAGGLGRLGVPGLGIPNVDPSSAAASRAAHRRAAVAAAMANARGVSLDGAGAGAAPADFSAVAAAQREAAAAAPGACARVTLAPRPGTRALDRPGSTGLASPRASKKRSGSRHLEAAAEKRAPVRRLAPAPSAGAFVADPSTADPAADPADPAARNHGKPRARRPAPLPPPERAVGDVFVGALGAVLGGVFGRDVTFGENHALDEDEDEGTPASSFAAAGREKLMRLGEEVHDALPVVAVPGPGAAGRTDGTSPGVRADAPTGERGRSTREPVADRTALGAEVDSVLVAAGAAHSAWRRHSDAAARLAETEAAAATARAALAAAADDAEGARMALDALESDALDPTDPTECAGVSRIMSGDTRTSGFASAWDAALRAATAAKTRERVAVLETARAAREADAAAAEASAAEARVASAACERTFRPAYEEVRKRALRLRLAAEERCERQIARVLSRAERDVAAMRARRAKEEAKERAAEMGASGADADGSGDGAGASLADAESALRVIKRAMDGCKTATEWSKSEIAKISSGRDV